MAANLNALVPRESGWVDRLFPQQKFTPAYQDLKFVLHRKLLDRINLEMLSSVAVERVRAEVRSAVAKLVEEEKTPLSLGERAHHRRSAGGGVWIRAAGTTAGRSDHFRYFGHHAQAGVHRTRRETVPHARAIQG